MQEIHLLKGNQIKFVIFRWGEKKKSIEESRLLILNKDFALNYTSM